MSAVGVVWKWCLLEYYWSTGHARTLDRMQAMMGELFTAPRGEGRVESSNVKRIFNSGASLKKYLIFIKKMVLILTK